MPSTQTPVTEQHQNINIAVLYAEADKQYWEELERHINLLRRMHRNLHVWTARDVELGQMRNQQIRDQLRRADITLLLLSADFAYADVFDEETRILLDTFAQQRQGQRYILPVIVKDFLWRDHYDDNFDIEKLKFVDKLTQQPDDKEKIYKEIAETLNRYVEEINAKSIHFTMPTWVGYIGGIMYNGGFIKSKETSLYQQFNRTLRFELNDDTNQVCDAWLSGETDLIWSTIDRLPFILNKLRDFSPKVIFQASWSNGADAILVRNDEIQSVADLKGKKVLYPYGSPAHTFLKHVLKENGLDTFDIAHMPQKNPNLDVLTRAFKDDPSISAAVLWSPYVEACLHEVPGARILSHTGEYPNLIADVVVAGAEYINLNKEELTELFSGWLRQIQHFVDDKAHEKSALEVLIDAIIQPLPAIIPSKIRDSLTESLYDYFESSLAKVHLCTLADNRSFFGLDAKGEAPAETLYRHFLELQYPEFTRDLALQWPNVVDASILERIALKVEDW